MSLPKPPEPPDYSFQPLPPKSTDKPNLKDFDHEANWRPSATNSSIEINIITGRLRTKDFSKPENVPKGI